MIRAIVVMALLASVAPSPGPRWSKVERSPEFRGWRQELQRVADTEGRAPKDHFCLVVQTFTPEGGPYDLKKPKEESVALVLWREERQVREWAGSDPAGRILSVPGSAVLDLRKDIVPTANDLHGSTFRETGGWLASIRRHCARSGTQVIVTRRAD